MPDSVLGLPLHPLVVHAVVVLLPLATLGALVLAVVPRWRAAYGWLVLGLAVIGTASVPVATNAGESLQRQLQAGGVVAERIREHSQWGERVVYAALPMTLLLLAGVLLARSGRRGGLSTLVWVLAAVAGVATTALVVVTGHLGSVAVWKPAG